MGCANKSQTGNEDEKSSVIAVKSEVSLAPLRTLSSVEDITDRSKRILETLERAIEAYSQARIHLSNVDIEESKIADANHTQESIAREILAQGDQFIDVIRADPRHELGLDALSDFALMHIRAYNSGLDTMAHKCDRLESDIAEVTRLISWCQVSDTPDVKELRKPRSANRPMQINPLRAQSRAKHTFLNEMSARSQKIRRRASVLSSTDSSFSEETMRQPQNSGLGKRLVMQQIPKQALAPPQPMSLLRTPQSLTEIFNYVIAQK